MRESIRGEEARRKSKLEEKANWKKKKKMKNKNPQTILAGTGLILSLLMFMGGCVNQSSFIESTSGGTSGKDVSLSKNSQIPQSITVLEETSEDAYDDAKTKSWTQLSKKISTLETIQTQVSSNHELIPEKVALLKASLGTKDSLSAMQAANQLTLSAVNLKKNYPQTTPGDISLLDYYGRELEIGVLSKNQPKLSNTAKAIEKTWRNLKPDVLAHGGKREADLFNTISNGLAKAKSLDEFSHLASTELGAVDQLEAVYTK